MRYNRRHKRFSLVGGHCEAVDEGEPRRTLERELWEELGAPWEAIAATEAFASPLLQVQYSEPAHQTTCYVHHFFHVDWQAMAGHVSREQPEDLRWTPIDQLLSDRLPPQVSSTPLSQLRELLAAIERNEEGTFDWKRSREVALGFNPPSSAKEPSELIEVKCSGL